MSTVEEAELARQKQQEAVRLGEQEPPEEDEQEIDWYDQDSDKENKFLLPVGRSRPG
jgi:hypothetical protein